MGSVGAAVAGRLCLGAREPGGECLVFGHRHFLGAAPLTSDLAGGSLDLAMLSPTAGTFLDGKIHVGLNNYAAGPGNACRHRG